MSIVRNPVEGDHDSGAKPISDSGLKAISNRPPQSPVTRWHEQIGDPTVADGILDRLVHNAHRIEMRGDSMRKNRGKANT